MLIVVVVVVAVVVWCLLFVIVVVNVVVVVRLLYINYGSSTLFLLRVPNNVASWSKIKFIFSVLLKNSVINFCTLINSRFNLSPPLCYRSG